MPMASMNEQTDLDSNTVAHRKMEKNTRDSDWNEWRNGLKAVGGHGFASFLGCNPNESARMALKRLREDVKRPEPDGFSLAAMTHGKLYEPYTARLLRHYEPGLIQESDIHNGKSTLWTVEFKKEGKTLDVVTTPDILCDEVVYEIKCPYYRQDEYVCPKTWADEWLKQNQPWGKTAYWAQAALYALMEKKDLFNVSVNFVTEDELMLVRTFHFQMTDAARELIIDTLKEIACCERGSKLTRTKQYKLQVDKIVDSSFYYKQDTSQWHLHINGLLEEKSSNDTWNNRE